MPKHFVEPEELQAYLDHELAPARQEEVARHLKDCQECSATIADLQKVSSTLRRWQIEPAPANLKPPALVIERPQRGWNWTRFALGFGASAAVVLLFAAVSIPNLLRSRIAANRTAQIARERSSAGGLQLDANKLAPGHGIPGDEELPQAVLGSRPGTPAGRLIAYQVTMVVEVKDFDPAKQQLLHLVEQAGGYVAQASTAETPNRPRSARLVVRVPATGLSPILEKIRALGRVKQEQLSTEEVTDQVVDLEARLKNARTTEQRLIDVLKDRTGKVKDILEVEREIARTREEIERMEAQRQNLMRRVEMATVSLTLTEEFKAQLETTPIGTETRLWNALVDGYDGFVGTILGIMLFVARYGLSLAFWGGALWLGWRLVRRAWKRRLAQAA